MKKNMKDIFDNYLDETVELNTSTSISSQRIFELTKNKIMEEQKVIKNSDKVKRIRFTPIMVAAIIMVLSITVFAAISFLTPKDVAEKFQKYELSKAFSENDTILDIPAQTSGDYTIKLLGMTSGKNLDEIAEADVDKNHTYIVGAITKKDGTPMTDYSDLTITPLVEGYEPWRINIFSLGDGNKHSFIYEGAEYFLIECGSVEIFADRQVYIAAFEGVIPNRETFVISEEGTISFNKSYVGARFLFEISLDKSKADAVAVNALLEKHGWDMVPLVYGVSEGDVQQADYGIAVRVEDVDDSEVNTNVSDSEHVSSTESTTACE